MFPILVPGNLNAWKWGPLKRRCTVGMQETTGSQSKRFSWKTCVNLAAAPHNEQTCLIGGVVCLMDEEAYTSTNVHLCNSLRLPSLKSQQFSYCYLQYDFVAVASRRSEPRLFNCLWLWSRRLKVWDGSSRAHPASPAEPPERHLAKLRLVLHSGIPYLSIEVVTSMNVNYHCPQFASTLLEVSRRNQDIYVDNTLHPVVYATLYLVRSVLQAKQLWHYHSLPRAVMLHGSVNSYVFDP